MRSKEYTDLVNATLIDLAKEMSADIISLSLEDLEDIAEEFDRQHKARADLLAKQKQSDAKSEGDKSDPVSKEEKPATRSEEKPDISKKEEQPDVESKADVIIVGSEPEQPDRVEQYGLAAFFFGTPSTRNSSPEQLERNEAAVLAVLDTPRRKALQQSPRREIEAPILVVFKDALKLMDTGKDRRYLTRFRDQTGKQRTQSRKICLLATAPDDRDNDACSCSSCMAYSSQVRLQKKLRASASVVKVGQITSKKSDSDHEDSIRRLKRSLRRKLPVKYERDLLAPYLPWSHEDLKSTLQRLAASKWESQDFDRAAKQIQGRAASKQTLEMGDIIEVLQRIDRQKRKAKKEDPNCGSDADNEDVDSELEVSRTRVSPRYILTEIQAKCNEYEKRLLECKVNTKKLDTTFEDIIIDPETKQSIIQLLKLFSLKAEGTSTKLLNQLRMNGALFYGPPGTGKTLLARAIANSTGASMLSIDAANINDKWVGESESLIKAAFTLATKMFPCVLFIDEVDALFYRRSSEDKSWQRAMLTQFLAQMDGLTSSEKRPFVVVATNRPKDLDEAFMRRLPHKVLFTLPAQPARAQILRVFLKDDDLDSEVNIDAMASLTDGYSGSDLKNLCGEAALAWAVEQTSDVLVETPGRSTDAEAAGTTSDKNGLGDMKSAKLLLTNEHFRKALRKTQPKKWTQ